MAQSPSRSQPSARNDTPRSGGAATGSGEQRGKETTSMDRTPQSTTGGDGGVDLAGQGQAIAGQAQEQASMLVGRAREQATTQLATQKERAATTLGTLATALHDASRQVRDQDDAAVAGYIDTAANQVEHLATMLQNQDIGQLIDTTGRFARRQPALFFGAAIALGFAGARFLRSSSQSSGPPMGSSSFARSGAGDWSGQYGAGSGGGYASVLDSSLGYGSPATAGGRGGFDAAAGAGAGTSGDWQTRSSFDSGPEGQ